MDDIREYILDLLKTQKGVASLVGAIVILMVFVIGTKKKYKYILMYSIDYGKFYGS